jgi:hypothetical protein
MPFITDRKISTTHYLIIISNSKMQPMDVLNMILQDNLQSQNSAAIYGEESDLSYDIEEDDALKYDDKLEEQDFPVIYVKSDEWKFGIYKDKEKLFEENIPKLSSHLTSLYRSNIIRYAEWHPAQNQANIIY